MTVPYRFLIHAAIEIELIDYPGENALCAAARAALQVGLNARVTEVQAHRIEAPPRTAGPSIQPPPSTPSKRDQVIEEYLHSGMVVQIFRNAGLRARPTFFAVVLNPAAKMPTGAVITAPTYVDLKLKAEARAERKAELFRRKTAV